MTPETIHANACAAYLQFMRADCERLAYDLFDRHVLLLRRYCDMTGSSMRDVARDISLHHIEKTRFN